MRVLLVNMPFGSIRPAIGPSLLKAHLQTINCEATVAYLNLRFAGLLGSADFTYIADRSPPQSLVGEWIFAPSLFGPRPVADRDYLKAFEDRFGIYAPTGDNIPALHRARQIAETFIDECLREVKWDSFDVIGFTSTFTQNVASLALARRLKDRYPDKTIIFGGANCEDRMGLALHRSFPFVDYVCSGEADISFPRLITALRDGGDPAQIPGVIARSGGESVYTSLSPERIRDLNTLP